MPSRGGGRPCFDWGVRSSSSFSSSGSYCSAGASCPSWRAPSDARSTSSRRASTRARRRRTRRTRPRRTRTRRHNAAAAAGRVRMMSLFVPEIGIWEKVLRSVVVYLFVLLAFRFTGKRQVGQLTPFDLVVLLIISNVVQNAVIGPDNSLGGGLLGAAVILGLNYAFVDLTFRSKRLRRLLEATPTLLIHNGQILHQNLKKERITLHDLHAALRPNRIADAEHVRVAVLEENGGVSGVPPPARGAGPLPGPLSARAAAALSRPLWVWGGGGGGGGPAPPPRGLPPPWA